MPDGKRKRRHDINRARRQWYAQHRARRFQRRFGFRAYPGTHRGGDSGDFGFGQGVTTTAYPLDRYVEE